MTEIWISIDAWDQACANTQKKSDNYGIMQSRLECKLYAPHEDKSWTYYTISRMIAMLRYILERMIMRINTYKYVQLLSFKSDN